MYPPPSSFPLPLSPYPCPDSLFCYVFQVLISPWRSSVGLRQRKCVSSPCCSRSVAMTTMTETDWKRSSNPRVHQEKLHRSSSVDLRYKTWCWSSFGNGVKPGVPVCECVCACDSCLPGEGYVALYATPNPFLLTKICLNQTGRSSCCTWSTCNPFNLKIRTCHWFNAILYNMMF